MGKTDNWREIYTKRVWRFIYQTKKPNFKQEISIRVYQKKIKSSWKELCHMKALQILTNDKHFLKPIKPIKVWLCLLYKITDIIATHDFSPSLFELRGSFLPPWTKYSKLKTTFHINLFVVNVTSWELFIAKYLIAATLRFSCHYPFLYPPKTTEKL